MLFYVLIYVIQLIIRDKKSFYWTSFGILFAITCCVAFFSINEQRMLYTGSGFKQAWPGYFTTMFLGFILGKSGTNYIEKYKKASYCIISLIVAIIIYYGILFVLPKTNLLVSVGIISLIPLYIILVSWYMLGECKCFERLYSSKLWFPFKFVSSLCWEIYLAQLWIVLRYEELINLVAFPLNIVVCFLLIILCAYVIKALSRFIIQLFNKDSFDWNYMIQTWNR